MPLNKQEFARLVAEMPDASDDEILAEAARREQAAPQTEEKGMLGKAWDAVRTPLTDLPSRAAKAVSDKITTPTLGHDNPVLNALGFTSENLARAKGFYGGALEGAGNVASQMTAPLDLALSLVGGAGVAAGRKGLLGISKAARGVEAGLQAPIAAEGAYNTVEGLAEGNITKAGMGVTQAALGAAGAKSAFKHAFPVNKVAEAYAAERGLPKPRSGQPPVKLDTENSKRIADAYEAMPHAPEDPAVKASYDALSKETSDQFKFMVERAGVKVEPWKGPAGSQPYANSAEMMADVQKNNHLYYFETDAGYGSGGEVAQHPLLAQGASGRPVNDEFRAIHDYFGHAKEGHQFGPRGEENAWVEHSQMFSPEAVPAMTSETRGQNSWVNFGRHLRRDDGSIPSKGQEGFVPPQERPFADQKAGLLPEEFHRRADVGQSSPAMQTASLRGQETPAAAGLPVDASGLPPEFVPVGAEPPVARPQFANPLEAVVDKIAQQGGRDPIRLAKEQAARGVGESPAPTPQAGHSLVDAGTETSGGAPLQSTPIEEMLQFEHRSNTPGVTELDPSFYGKAQAGREMARKQAYPKEWVDRSFGTVKGGVVEGRFQKSPHVYEGEVPKSSIYDITDDPQGFLQQLQAQAGGDNAQLMTLVEKAIKDAGFKGYRASKHESPFMRDAVVLFEKMPVKARQAAEAPSSAAAGSTALAVGAPAASMAIPDDPDSKVDDYGRIGLNILGAAGLLGAAVRGRQVKQLSAMEDAVHKGAAALWTGGQKAFKQAVGNAGPKVLEASKKVIERHLKTTEGQMTKTKKLLGMIKANAADATWYDQTGTELQALFGQDAELVAKFLAATSNNATVSANASLALKALKQHKAGEPFTGYLPTVIDNLNRVVKGEAIGELNGRKVDNFVKALMGDPDAVVVDRWIMRAFGFNSGTAPTDLQYDFMENAIRQMAQAQGVTPRQAQAAIWFAVKNAAEAGKKRPPSPPMEVALKDSIGRQHQKALVENRKFDKARKNPGLFD